MIVGERAVHEAVLSLFSFPLRNMVCTPHRNCSRYPCHHKDSGRTDRLFSQELTRLSAPSPKPKCSVPETAKPKPAHPGRTDAHLY